MYYRGNSVISRLPENFQLGSKLNYVLVTSTNERIGQSIYFINFYFEFRYSPVILVDQIVIKF